MNDLASGTSSCSTKLIHGGLRYLEHYEFRLVREIADGARGALGQGAAHHLAAALRAALPQGRHRPAWLIRLGLFLYDHIGGRKLLAAHADARHAQRSGRQAAQADLLARPSNIPTAGSNDARLVVLNARDAADRGAMIRTRTQGVAARREKRPVASIAGEDRPAARVETIGARLLVNAAGPWVDHVLSGRGRAERRPHMSAWSRAATSSSEEVRRTTRLFLPEQADGRIIFAIPYEDDFTLIGTTDRDFPGDPQAGDDHRRRDDLSLRRRRANISPSR